MGSIIGASIIALLGLMSLIGRVKGHFRSVDKAVDVVLKELAAATAAGEPNRVRLWAVHPLSDHMVKEIAESRGWQYRGEGTVSGARALKFTYRRGSRKLSLDV